MTSSKFGLAVQYASGMPLEVMTSQILNIETFCVFGFAGRNAGTGRRNQKLTKMGKRGRCDFFYQRICSSIS